MTHKDESEGISSRSPPICFCNKLASTGWRSAASRLAAAALTQHCTACLHYVLIVAAHVHKVDFALTWPADWCQLALHVLHRYLGMDCHLILRTSRQLADSDPGLTGNLLLSRMVSLPSSCSMHSLGQTTDLATGCRGTACPGASTDWHVTAAASGRPAALLSPLSLPWRRRASTSVKH